jgi:fimbrial chaperone protein
MRSASKLALLAVAAALAGTVVPAGAASLEIAPTTVILGKHTGAGLLYVNNDGDEPITVQIEPLDWSQSENKDRLQESEALMASPAIVTIPAGGKQTVRLLLSGSGSSALERSFRLLVSQLPDPLHNPTGHVQVLTQFSVPVFAPDDATGPSLEWNAVLASGKLHVTASNHGGSHSKLQDLKFVLPRGDASASPGNGLNYILEASSRTWDLPCSSCAPGDTLKVEGTDDAANSKVDQSVVLGK